MTKNKTNFNWLGFVKAYRIPYVTTGPNVATGNINIKCPFCGTSDPSEHMGLSTTGSVWACWRNPRHRGREPKRLVFELLKNSGFSWTDVYSIYGSNQRKNLSELERQYQQLTQRPVESPSEYQSLLQFAPDMLPIGYRRGVTYRGEAYLHSRRISLSLAKDWQLHYAPTGVLQYRIGIPVLNEQGKEVSWTSRTISSQGFPRYKSVTAEANDEWNIKRHLYGIQCVPEHCNGLVLVEGPVDVWRFNYVGQHYGVYAVGVFGSSLSLVQRMKVRALLPRIQKLCIAFDADNVQGVMNEVNHFSDVGAVSYMLDDQKDFGGMTNQELHYHLGEICSDMQKKPTLNLSYLYTKHLKEDADARTKKVTTGK